LVLGFFGSLLSAQAALTLTNNSNAQQLANALVGTGVTVVANSATLQRVGGQQDTGTFTGGTTGGAGPVIGIDSGVVITSGSLSTSVAGPNNRKNSSVSKGTLSDADLTTLAGSSARYGTVILEFQVIPSGRSLNFQFVFGSEEYPEYVCSAYNDAMGIFVSGPGITGPYSGNATNLAVLPNGTRISINNINGGVVGYQAGTPAAGCNLTNTAYYVDNGDPNSATAPNATLFTNTQMDGFTKPLRSRVTVTPGQTYRIKLVIADVGDDSYDSSALFAPITSQSDWGDAPDTYGTTAAASGALHDIDSQIYIGPTAPDPESNGQPSTNADGDNLNGSNDENTFSSFPTLTSSSISYTLSNIPVTNTTGLPAVLAGWIDFNRNGQFDPGERATANVASGATGATLQWTGLSGLVVGQTYLRLRLSSDLSFVGNPQATGGADNGEVEDYTLNIVFGAMVSGTVYSDLQPNAVREQSENWSSGTSVYINLVQSGSVVQSVVVNPGTGAFSFSEVATGSYILVLTNSASSTTPLAPSGWVFINPGGSLSFSVASSNILNQDFGLFNGSKVSGTVFRDDGQGGGTANNALQDGGEAGLGNIVVTAAAASNSRSVTTDASGNYLIYIPTSFGSAVTVSHILNPATGTNMAGASVVLASSFNDANARSRSLSPTSGQSYSGYNFGVVRSSEWKPDQSGQTTSPGVLALSHLYRPGTLGNVSLSLGNGGFAYQVRRDANCNGTFDASETYQTFPLNFTVDATWPRDADGSFKACAIEIMVIVPAGIPTGTVDIVQVGSALSWANNASVSETRFVTDTTTVLLSGSLMLTKQVRNVTQGGSFANNAQGKPGEVLEYCIVYRNVGTSPITNVVVTDPVPFFTSYSTSTLFLNSTFLTDATDADAGEVSSGIVRVRVGTLNAGGNGSVCYRVQVR